MTSHIPLGFALIPNQEGLRYVAQLNQAIHSYSPSEFILKDESTLLPHVSLFQGVFDVKYQNTLRQEIERMWSPLLKPIRVKSGKVSLWINRIIFLDLEITEQIANLQNEIINKLNPIRSTRLGSADPQPLVGLSSDEQVSIDRYSYPFAGKAFRPHFTVGRVETSFKSDYLDQWFIDNPIPTEFQFDRFVIFEVGMFGRLEGIQIQWK